MPILRADKFVAPAIRSILNQRATTVELIIVGPPETDPALVALEELLHHEFLNESRLTVIAREQLGIAHALNLGLQHANYDYIARMDADDLCEPDRLERQLAASSAYGDRCIVSACVSIFCEEHSVQNGNQHYEAWLNEHRTPESIRNACFVESPLPHPTWLAHRTVWEQMGAYRHGDFPEDYDRVLTAWLLNIPMVKPDGVLLKWREHRGRLTKTDKRYRREAFIQLKALALADSRSGLYLDEGRAVWIAGTGRNARYWHDALEQCSVRVAGFVELDKLNAKNQKRHKPVINYQTLSKDQQDDLLVTAVTAPIAREKLKQWCDEQELVLGVHAVIGG